MPTGAETEFGEKTRVLGEPTRIVWMPFVAEAVEETAADTVLLLSLPYWAKARGRREKSNAEVNILLIGSGCIIL